MNYDSHRLGYIESLAAPGCHNLLETLPNLRNKYFAIRHGQSEANVQKIISSHPDVSTVTHGLSSVGIEQARQAGKELAAAFSTDVTNAHVDPEVPFSSTRNIVIVSSDYLRAKETAELIAEEFQKVSNCNETSSKSCLFNAQPFRLEKRLRERSFGSFHGSSDTNYAKVWQLDEQDANHTEWDVESVNSVLSRTTQLILDLEKEFANDVDSRSTHTIVLLIAHGDVLQILQTAFAKMDGKRHRTLPHLETASPRELIFFKSNN